MVVWVALPPTPAFPPRGTCLGIVVRCFPLLCVLSPLYLDAHTTDNRSQEILPYSRGVLRNERRTTTCFLLLLTRGPLSWPKTIAPRPFMTLQLTAIVWNSTLPYNLAIGSGLGTSHPNKKTGGWGAQVDLVRVPLELMADEAAKACEALLLAFMYGGLGSTTSKCI